MTTGQEDPICLIKRLFKEHYIDPEEFRACGISWEELCSDLWFLCLDRGTSARSWQRTLSMLTFMILKKPASTLTVTAPRTRSTFWKDHTQAQWRSLNVLQILTGTTTTNIWRIWSASASFPLPGRLDLFPSLHHFCIWEWSEAVCSRPYRRFWWWPDIFILQSVQRSTGEMGTPGSMDDTLIDIKSDGIYRSLHYIIKYRGYYVEIQGRTLLRKAGARSTTTLSIHISRDDMMLKDFSTLLNRLSGMADEMSSYFRRMRDERRSIEEQIEQLKEGDLHNDWVTDFCLWQKWELKMPDIRSGSGYYGIWGYLWGRRYSGFETSNTGASMWSRIDDCMDESLVYLTSP